MRRLLMFFAGLCAGVVLTIAVGAHADWNDSSVGSSPDRRLLDRLASASEQSARHLGEIARSSSESARVQADTVRALSNIERRCR